MRGFLSCPKRENKARKIADERARSHVVAPGRTKPRKLQQRPDPPTDPHRVQCGGKSHEQVAAIAVQNEKQLPPFYFFATLLSIYRGAAGRGSSRERGGKGVGQRTRP